MREPLKLIESVELSLPPVPIPWTPIAISAAVLMALGLLTFWLLRRRRIRLSAPVPPEVIALHELDRLERESSLLGANEFALRVSNIMRVYIQGRFDLRAPTLSTEDFLAQAATSHRLEDPDRGMLEQFLKQCDRVKFARVHLQTVERTSLCSRTREFIRDTTQRVEQEEAVAQAS